MRSLLLTGLSVALTAAVIGNAYYQKQQFYPSVVYITKSNPSMAVMYIQALVFVVLMGKLLRALFFGQLRAAEMEHLIERSWYAVTETCLAFTVFRDDFSPRFVALFTLLLFLKCFHWLAEDRIDFMERSPAISWLFHVRALSLMFVLGVLDILFVRHAFYSTMLKGPSVQLVFGFEYEILFTVVLMTFIKYVLHLIDLRSQNPWDNKAVYLLYSELVMGLIRVVLYVTFVFIMIKVHTFPLFAIRPMYLTVRAFQKAAQDVVLSRRAIRNMNTLYPDATPEELSSGDNVCIICREEMTSGCKKLPCNHIFHTSCLRSWFQRQQSCPTCRLEVLRIPRPAAAGAAPGPAAAAAAAGQQAQQPQQQQQQQPDNMQNPFPNIPGMFAGFPFQWPPNAGGPGVPPFMWQPPQQQQQQQQPPTTAAGQASTSTTTQSSEQAQQPATTTTTPPTFASYASAPSPPPPAPSFASPFMPPGPPPPFMSMMPPMFLPFGFPPPPPVPMDGLCEEELLVMEGVERSNIEARIQWLRDIQALLDGAMVLLNQYNVVSSHLGAQGINALPRQPGSMGGTASASSHTQPHTTQPHTQGQWWPEGSGARPKYSSTASKTETTTATATTTSSSRGKQSSSTQEEEADRGKSPEGASGVTEQLIPEWDNPRENQPEDDMNEVRKRRLQHFSVPANNEQGSAAATFHGSPSNDDVSNSSTNNNIHGGDGGKHS